MPPNSFSKLETTIAAAARERDAREKQSSDEQADRERIRHETRTAWSVRKSELAVIVDSVDAMLKRQGYRGLSLGNYEFKHTDIDRVVIHFEHTHHNRTKILIAADRMGDFTCSVAGAAGDVYAVTLPITELTTKRLEQCVADVVSECLTAEWAPRSESFRP